jgi:hypothetical protein
MSQIPSLRTGPRLLNNGSAHWIDVNDAKKAEQSQLIVAYLAKSHAESADEAAG